jgi:uncharacterized protein (DUF362 family)
MTKSEETLGDYPAQPETGQHIDRRAFIRKGSVSLAGAGLAALFNASDASGEQAQKKSKIVMVKHDGATNDRGLGIAPTVRQMVNRSMRELTGKDSLADAWREFVSPDDVVGVKINLRGGRNLSTQPCVAEAIVFGLGAAGVKANNIILWDAWSREFSIAGFKISASDEGVRYRATDHESSRPRQVRDKDALQEAVKDCYSSEPVMVADKPVYFSKIYDEITALINVPLIKDHTVAGVTVSMKNHYGSILNPNDLHPNACDPYLAELNATAPIKDKTRLIIVDGLRSIYNKGPRDDPRYRWRQNSIIAGTDTVAVDYLGLQIIEQKRKENDLPPIGKRARHIATAAKIGLGTNDPAQIDLKEIDLTPTA